MQRELSSFPLPPAQRYKLHSAGFITVEDLQDVKPSELSKELNLSNEEALEILKTVKGDDSGTGKSKVESGSTMTALDMLKDEQSQQTIITFSEQLDSILGGGVPLTKITEFCGAPGVGKTQICLQLSVDVQIPSCFHGLGGQAVYIDTEGSFIVDRLADIARAAVNHCQHITGLEGNEEQEEAMKWFNLEHLLAGVHYFRCHDYVELIATVHLLPDFLRQHPKVKVVVVDSIAFHFRHDFEDMSLRTRLLNGMAQSFNKIASEHKLAVVLTNQMTTKVSMDSTQQSHLIPALGESWGHASTIRIILYWNNSVRYAMLYKSPSRKEATVPYQITMGGVRDVPSFHGDEEEPTLEEMNTDQPRKRPRLDAT